MLFYNQKDRIGHKENLQYGLSPIYTYRRLIPLNCQLVQMYLNYINQSYLK